MKRIAKIPQNLPLQTIQEVSPSTYTRVTDGCAYSLLLCSAQQNSQDAPSILMPPHQFKNSLGTIVHKILQLVGNGQLEPKEGPVTETWRCLCQNEQGRLRAQYPLVRTIELCDYDLMFDTLKLAKQVPISGRAALAASDRYVGNEKTVKVEGLLKGSIDRVQNTQTGYEIVDYKTGKVYDESGQIKPEYVTQLNLYAYMFKQYTGIAPSRLVIIDRNGQEVEVPYDRDGEQRLVESVRKHKQRINEVIENGNLDLLKNPTEQNCGYCRCAHLCPQRMMTSAEFFIVEGRVVEVSGNNQIKLQTNGQEVIIANLRAWNIDDMDALCGKMLIFVNLRQIADNQFCRCDRTVVYEREQ